MYLLFYETEWLTDADTNIISYYWVSELCPITCSEQSTTFLNDKSCFRPQVKDEEDSPQFTPLKRGFIAMQSDWIYTAYVKQPVNRFWQTVNFLPIRNQCKQYKRWNWTAQLFRSRVPLCSFVRFQVLKTAAICISETSVSFYVTTWRNIPEYSTLLMSFFLLIQKKSDHVCKISYAIFLSFAEWRLQTIV